MLCFVGGAAGVGVGWSVFRGLLAIRPERLARIADTSLAGRPWCSRRGARSLAAALVRTAAGDAKLPARPHDDAAGHGLGWMPRCSVGGRMLVVGEMVLGFVLVTGSVLAARTLTKIEQVRPGFEPRQVLAFQISVGMRPGSACGVGGASSRRSPECSLREPSRIFRSTTRCRIGTAAIAEG